jgi:hypothetical protein
MDILPTPMLRVQIEASRIMITLSRVVFPLAVPQTLGPVPFIPAPLPYPDQLARPIFDPVGPIALINFNIGILVYNGLLPIAIIFILAKTSDVQRFILIT